MARLWVVATPIGNLSDLSPRARETLATADLIAAEDTRVTAALLSALGISKRMFPYHRHNEHKQAESLAARISAENLNAALVCDAGTPGISDPAAALVAACVQAGVEVCPVPGPSAVAAALSVCGFPGPGFAFYGFLPRENGPRAKALKEIAKDSIPIAVFFESPKRVLELIQSFVDVLPQAQLCLCHELTKTFEWIKHGDPSEVMEFLANNPDAEKGEYVLAADLSTCKNDETPALDPHGIVVRALLRGCSEKEAVSEAVAAGIPRNAAYKAMIELSKWRDDEE